MKWMADAETMCFGAVVLLSSMKWMADAANFVFRRRGTTFINEMDGGCRKLCVSAPWYYFHQ